MDDIKYSKDGVIMFRDSDHTYTHVETGENRKSISKLIESFKNTDFAALAAKSAKKRGLRVEDVREDWEERKEIACVKGTLLHLPFEQYAETGVWCHTSTEEYMNMLSEFRKTFKYTDWDKIPKDYEKYCKIVDKAIDSLFISGDFRPVGCEIIVYNDLYAGQIDNVSKLLNGGLFMMDWKTNKSIDDYNSEGTKMKYPFDFLKCTKISHYSLQLAFYRELYEQNTGEIIEDYKLIYLLKTKFKILDLKPIDRDLIRSVLKGEAQNKPLSLDDIPNL